MDFPGGNSDENVNFLNKDSCQNVLSEIQITQFSLCGVFNSSIVRGHCHLVEKNIEGVGRSPGKNMGRHIYMDRTILCWLHRFSA